MSATERREAATMLLFQQHREANRPHRYKAERLRDERGQVLAMVVFGTLVLFVYVVLPLFSP